MDKKLFLVALLITTSLVACLDAQGGDGPNSSASITTPEPSDDQLVLMYRSVIREVCESASPPLPCDAQIRVSEQFSGNGVTTTETLPLPVLAAAHAELPGITFVDPEDLLTPYIVLGPPDMPLSDAVAIQAGYICGNLCGQGTTYYFHYDGDRWNPASADDLGLPNEIWTS